jgi:hypothetical protein
MTDAGVFAMVSSPVHPKVVLAKRVAKIDMKPYLKVLW